jgi:predicted nucleic acid-binding protein
MYLIDTSVIIDVLQERENSKTALYGYLVANKATYGISILTYFEVLQGIKGERAYREVKRALETIKRYHLPAHEEPYEKAANLYRTCRAQGITPRSSIDLLIAQTALEHNLILLHNDHDFDQIARAIPELRILS